MSEIEDEIRASLVADLSLSHIHYHEAEDSADAALRRLKRKWAHELAEGARKHIHENWDENDFLTWNGGLFALDLIDPES